MKKAIVLGFYSLEFLEGKKGINKNFVHAYQTINFSESLIDSLSNIFSKIDFIFSEPISTFKRSNIFYIKSSNLLCKKINYSSLFFINFIFLKHLTRFSSSIWRVCKSIFSSRADIVIIHGLHLPYLITGLLIKWLFRINVSLIITDPSSVILNDDSFIEKSLKKIEKPIILTILKFFSSSIIFSNQLKDSLKLKGKTLTLQGILHPRILQYTPKLKPSNPHKLTYVYAGGLSRLYGIDSLVEAFKLQELQESILEIYGTGDLKESICISASQYPNIRFKGNFLPSEINNIFDSADFFINPRSANSYIAQNSFPSKTIEILGSGIPYICSSIFGLDRKVANNVILIKEDGAQGIMKAVLMSQEIPKKDLEMMTNEARKFIEHNFSPEAVSKKLSNFINHKV